jgi:hypothetical protein
MLADTVVKRDLQLACQNVKDVQPVGSWHIRDDNALCVETHRKEDFPWASSVSSLSTRRRKDKLYVLLLANNAFKEDEVDGPWELNQSMKLGGGRNVALPKVWIRSTIVIGCYGYSIVIR